jgi:ABC-type multidrug transport system ATPase subunit
MKTLRIGRHPDCDVILDSPLVSRFHAELVVSNEGHLVRDLGSANGTFIDGQRVVAAQPFQTGQELYVANVHLRFDGQNLREDGAHSAVGISLDEVCFRPRNFPRNLLERISLEIHPGQFVALVGTSGAGKSTLMSLLLGQNAPTQGHVLINGMSAFHCQEQFRHLMGFVPQDDIVHRVLPVEAALDYAAQLRLPSDTSSDERARRVEIALATMELTHRRDVPIARLSGGERKRVSMAAELLTDPSLLFLDEPTSGLDPGMEKKTMQLLSGLCRQGRTVVLITHATQNIVLCDQVALLAPGGRLVYFGPPQEALEFFNVPDFAEIYLEIGSHESGLKWQKQFAQKRTLLEQRPPAPASLPVQARKADFWLAWRQWWVLSVRYLHQLWADRANFWIMALQAPLIGVVLSLLFDPKIFARSQTWSAGQYPIKDAPTVLFLLVVSCIFFGSINACREIVKELPIFRRERLVNLNLLAYFFSKVGVLTLVGSVQALLLFIIISQRIDIGLASLELQLTLLAFLMAAAAGGTLLGLLLSCLAGSAEQSSSLVSVLLILQLSLSGAFIKPEQMLAPLYWLSTLAISRWTFAGVGEVAQLNQRFENLHLGWLSVDFFMPIAPLWGITLPLLGMHAVLALAALRWREGKQER